MSKGYVVPSYGTMAKLGAIGGVVAAPFLPKSRSGSGYGQGSSNGLVVRSTKRRPKRKSFESRIYDTRPGKHWAIDGGVTFRTMTHNVVFSMSPTVGLIQGNTDATRIGDAVYLCALKVKGNFYTASGSSGYQYRISVLWSGEEYNVGGVFTSAGLGKTEVYVNGTGATWAPTGQFNPKAVTVLYDEIIDIDSQVSGSVAIKGFAFTVPLNQKFSYQSNGSAYGKSKNLYVVVSSALPNGTTGTTATGAVVADLDLVFKDA